MPHRQPATPRQLAAVQVVPSSGTSTCPSLQPEEEYILRHCVFEEPYKDLFGRRILVAIDAQGVKIRQGYFIDAATREALNARLWRALEGASCHVAPDTPLEPPDEEYLFPRCVFEEPYLDADGRGILSWIGCFGAKQDEAFFSTPAEREAATARLIAMNAQSMFADTPNIGLVKG